MTKKKYPKCPPSWGSLETVLGYSFQDKSLLEKALMHSSLPKGTEFQRLEFLGDRILAIVIAHRLYEMFPMESEGFLAKAFSFLASRDSAYGIASQLHLEKHLQMTSSSNGKNVLADALEALLAAIFLDGGWQEAYNVIGRLWYPLFSKIKTLPQEEKTFLQEWLQSRGWALPHYESVLLEGNSSSVGFHVRVHIKELSIFFDGYGASKKIAEKEAARLAVAYVLENNQLKKR